VKREGEERDEKTPIIIITFKKRITKRRVTMTVTERRVTTIRARLSDTCRQVSIVTASIRSGTCASHSQDRCPRRARLSLAGSFARGARETGVDRTRSLRDLVSGRGRFATSTSSAGRTSCGRPSCGRRTTSCGAGRHPVRGACWLVPGGTVRAPQVRGTAGASLAEPSLLPVRGRDVKACCQ